MKEALSMSNHPTSPDLLNVTFSQALEAGHTRSDWLAGRMADPSGQVPVLANHSVLPEKAAELTTRDTFGQLFAGSSPSTDLQQCLESRLQARMDVNGCPEYELTWKQWDIGSGLPICALRASGLRTSGNDFSGVDGWPKTPQATDGDGGIMEIQPGTAGKYKLMDWAMMAGRPTAASRDHKDSPGMAETGTNPDGSERSRLDQLPRVANLLTGPNPSGGHAGTESYVGFRQDGWKTPTSNKTSGTTRADFTEALVEQVQHAGWGTPRVTTNDGTPCPDATVKGSRLEDQAGTLAGWITPMAGNPKAGNNDFSRSIEELAGFVTPQVKDYRGGMLDRWMNPVHAVGINDQAEVFRLPDMAGWKLNPAFSLWLMGYPVAWLWNAPIGKVRKNADLSTVEPLCLEPETPLCHP